MNPVFRVSLAASESLKSNILRRVREEEKQLSPEKMNARSSGCSRFGIRRQNQRTTSQQNGTRKLCGRSRSLRSSSRTQMKETCQGSNSETISESNSKSKTKGTSRARAGSGRARARGRGQGRPPSQIWVKEEASQNSSFLDTSGNSSVAKPRPGPIKRRLRSSTSLVPALSSKVRRLEDDSNREKTAPSSPSSSSTNRKNPWMVPESPCGLVIEEKKSPEHQRKISISESAVKEFCSSTGDTSCGIVCSTKSGRKKKYKVCLTKRLQDSCPATETLSKKMQPRSNLTRNKVSKQKKKENDSDGRATRRRSKDKDENLGPIMVNAQRTNDHLNQLLQDSGKSNPAGALKSVISQTSPGTSRKKHDGLVRELIHRRINETLAAQNGLKEDTKPTTTQSANTVVSSGMLLTNKQQSTPTAEQNPSQSDAEATTNSMTVTETAAVEAAKAVGGISLMPLHKVKNPDFLPTVSSPCTPTMTVMKASSDQTVSSTMSFESNLKGPKSKVPSDPETRQLPSGQSGTSSVLQPLAQCKCVDSVSTVPTPSLIEIGNIQAAQPIFLTRESFQFQPISYPGMAALNLVDPTTCLPELSKQKKKRNSKKKSVEKKSPSAVPSENTLSSVAVSSASSSLDPDTKDPDIKDPSLDDNGEKIKRPMNAFMIWSREQRAILACQTPRMTNADISVKLGIMWNDLDYSEKQKYFDEAIKLKLQHRKDYPDWVYQPRPHKRPSRRKRQPLPFCEEGRQQVPCSQMLLILPDGQQVICPAIPQLACQGAVPVVNAVAPAPVDIKDAKKISQPKEQATDAVTNSASSQPESAKDVKSSEDENKSTTQQSEQAKSKMLVIMPKGKQVECQVVPHQNGHTANPLTTNTVNSVTPKPSLDVNDVNLVSEQSTQPKSKLLLVMPDGKQVLCPEISKPETDVKVVKKSVNQPGELSKSSEEKLLVVKSEKCEKCEDKKSTAALKSQSGLPAATAVNLGPVIKLTKDMKNSNTETNISEGRLSSSAQSTKQQETTHEEKKGVTPLEMAVAKDQSETSQGATESAAATKPVMVQSDVQKVTEMKAIDKSDVTPVPVAIHVSAIAQVQTSEVGKNKSIAKSSDHLQPQLSNADQQSPLTEMISLQVAPVSSQAPQQDCTLPKATVNALKEMIISSRPHSADDSSLPQRQTIPNNDASQFQTGNFSQTHPAVRLYPLDFHQSVVPLQPMNKDTGVQTLHDWSSCTSNNQTNQTLPSNLPSSVLKNQPINMVWQSDSRILQPVNISDKGTSTSYPFYFTPIQQVQGVQETSNAPPMGSMMAFPAVPATVDRCTAPVPTATLTDSDPSDAAMSATQFANIPTLCEISEPERLLESLAMTAVEISEDEAEETENLFQRVMDMVPN